MVEIKLKNSGIVTLQHFDDQSDGVLTIGESGRSVPFEIKRVYYITQFKERTAVRGKHAHKKQSQIIFCVNGSFVLNLDDGVHKQSIAMANPYMGIKLGAMLWHEMTDFSPDCVILVLADDFYDANDYIRNYEDFLSLVK